MASSNFAREIDKDVVSPFVMNSQSIPHRNFYNTQFMNMPTKLENNFETGSRSGIERISHSDLLSHTDYNQSELLNSEGSSSESLASSRDNSQNLWVHEKTLHKMLPDDQVILPKKGQKQDKEDMFKKLSPRDYLYVTSIISFDKLNIVVIFYCRRVRTLYACLAENDGELSFEPNQIITYVRRSNERGWLIGTLNGKSGLIPENYVEVLP